MTPSPIAMTGERTTGTQSTPSSVRDGNHWPTLKGLTYAPVPGWLVAWHWAVIAPVSTIGATATPRNTAVAPMIATAPFPVIAAGPSLRRRRRRAGPRPGRPVVAVPRPGRVLLWPRAPDPAAGPSSGTRPGNAFLSPPW